MARAQKQNTSTKLKKGSKKYLHLRKFIETRRLKKLEKRCTLDPSALGVADRF